MCSRVTVKGHFTLMVMVLHYYYLLLKTSWNAHPPETLNQNNNNILCHLWVKKVELHEIIGILDFPPSSVGF